MNAVRSEKHAKIIGFTMKSMLLQVLKNVEKTMKKDMPQIDLLDPFADMGRTGVDCVCFLCSVGAVPKKHAFLIGQKTVKHL